MLFPFQESTLDSSRLKPILYFSPGTDRQVHRRRQASLWSVSQRSPLLAGVGVWVRCQQAPRQGRPEENRTKKVMNEHSYRLPCMRGMGGGGGGSGGCGGSRLQFSWTAAFSGSWRWTLWCPWIRQGRGGLRGADPLREPPESRCAPSSLKISLNKMLLLLRAFSARGDRRAF